jgi:hypothetical protein
VALVGATAHGGGLADLADVDARIRQFTSTPSQTACIEQSTLTAPPLGELHSTCSPAQHWIDRVRQI